eukprot:TRINITY_DN7096_c0_g1_i1.p1 TRINITY_DN7096_c0_g1~~TRINITY_DN7096_c0_g1_i1.p1  ORF type:complete len:872 (+),score=170.73 TRINITY_DN7096_c0_g1_i1:62-2677(+)
MGCGSCFGSKAAEPEISSSDGDVGEAVADEGQAAEFPRPGSDDHPIVALEQEEVSLDAADPEHARAKDALMPFLADQQRISREAVPRLCALAESSLVRGLCVRLEALNVTQGAGIPLPRDAWELLRGSENTCSRMGFSPEQVARICRALGRCVDTLLYPVLERGIDLKRKENEEQGVRPDISAFARACRESVHEDAQRLTESAPPRKNGGHWQPLPLLCICIRSALLTLAWLGGVVPRTLVDPSASPVPPSAFYVSSVNHLVCVLDGTLVTPHLGTESADETVQGMRALIFLLSSFGALLSISQPLVDEEDPLKWMKCLPFFALDAATKEMLLYAISSVIGCKRVSLPTLPRQSTLQATLRAVEAAGVLSCGATQLTRVNPQFAGEPGEGHGPRKELFDLLGQELQADWGLEFSSDSLGATASLQEGSAHVLVYHSGGDAANRLKAGCRLVFRSLSSAFEHEHISIDDTLEMVCHQADHEEIGVLRMRCDRISPVTIEKTAFGMRPPAVPCFRASSSAPTVWFNTGVDCLDSEVCHSPTSLKGREREQWVQKYAFVGWLMAAAIANGVSLPVNLPSVFFAILKDWPTYTPLEEHLTSLGGVGGGVSTVRTMPEEELTELLRLQQLPTDMSREDYVKHLCTEALQTQIAVPMTALAESFHATGLGETLVFRHCSPDELRAIICGRRDDNLGDFNFRCEFRFVVDGDFRRFPHNEVLLDALWAVIDSGLDAPDGDRQGLLMKRRFLKFLTGRVRLPALPQHETVRFVFGTCPMTAAEYTEQLQRLPVAHTCDNSLEIPNYAEALLFCQDSEWYKLAERPTTTPITNEDRARAWQQIQDTRPDLLSELKKQIAIRLRSKLVTAVCSTDRYDLDD